VTPFYEMLKTLDQGNSSNQSHLEPISCACIITWAVNVCIGYSGTGTCTPAAVQGKLRLRALALADQTVLTPMPMPMPEMMNPNTAEVHFEHVTPQIKTLSSPTYSR